MGRGRVALLRDRKTVEVELSTRLRRAFRREEDEASSHELDPTGEDLAAF